MTIKIYNAQDVLISLHQFELGQYHEFKREMNYIIDTLLNPLNSKGLRVEVTKNAGNGPLSFEE